MKLLSKIFMIITVLASLPQTSLAAEASDQADAHVHGSHLECPLPKNAMDVVLCAREQAPPVQRAKLSLDQARGLKERASQFKNPDLEIESVAGRINGERREETKVAVLVPLEIGGKRAARKREAESETKIIDAELYEVQSEITIETVLKLHRLRQLEQEKSVLGESIETFQQVISQQRSRPGLSPEQRTSLSVFRMALAEAKIRQSELFEEEKALEHYFHVSTGHSLSELKAALPMTPPTWPTLAAPSEKSVSPALAKSRAELDLAGARGETARSETWPELRIGPMASLREEFGTRESIYGFQLSVGLPVLSWNGGERHYARLGEARASRGLELTRSEESHERAEQVKIYERAVQTLKEAPSAEAIEKEHSQQKGHARRGLVSPALIIESHRQIEELTHSRHGRELKALESLWKIHKFDGVIFEEKL